MIPHLKNTGDNIILRLFRERIKAKSNLLMAGSRRFLSFLFYWNWIRKFPFKWKPVPEFT